MLWKVDHASPTSLRDQIVTSIRRGLISHDLKVGDQLPPAAELAAALSVDRNTVLAAYRELRTDGILEFRRGRGARITQTSVPANAVLQAARRLIELSNRHGLDRDDLTRLIQELV